MKLYIISIIISYTLNCICNFKLNSYNSKNKNKIKNINYNDIGKYEIVSTKKE